MSVIHDDAEPRKIPGEVGRLQPGWQALALRLHQVLENLDPGYELRQLGSSMGGLDVRVRASSGHRAARLVQAVGQARRASLRICEMCGEPGSLNHVGPGLKGWWSTSCAICRGRRWAPDSHQAWKIVDDNSAPLPAGKGGYQVVVDTREGALRTFGRILRLCGWVLVDIDGSRTKLTVDRNGVHEVWTLTPVMSTKAA